MRDEKEGRKEEASKVKQTTMYVHALQYMDVCISENLVDVNVGESEARLRGLQQEREHHRVLPWQPLRGTQLPSNQIS